MSSICGKLCFSIVKEHFGESVELVANDLFRYGQKPLRLICLGTEISRKSVRQSLCVLIQHGFVTFSVGKSPESAEYRLHPDRVLLLLRYPKYLITSLNLHGKEAEVMIDELLRHGSCSLSEVIIRACSKLSGSRELDNALVIRLRDLFEVLVNKQYIQRCPSPPEEGQPVPVMFGDHLNRFSPPKSDLSSLLACATNGKWDRKDPVVWAVNHYRFQQDMRSIIRITDNILLEQVRLAKTLTGPQQMGLRLYNKLPSSLKGQNLTEFWRYCSSGVVLTPDELLVNAMTRRISKTAGEILSHLLRQAYLISPPNAPQSSPVLISQFRDHCKKAKMDVRNLDDNLAVMVDDACGFISRDDFTNGSYIIQMQHAVEELTWSVLANAVEVRYSPNAARIFRLIRAQEYIEQDEIQKRAMLPDKECKRLTYCLIQNGWIQQQELKKGVQKSGPTKTFYLFCIDLNQVVRMYIEACYKGLYNCTARRDHEYSQNTTLLNKKHRIDAIVYHMELKSAPKEEIDDVKDLLTPPEVALLDKIQATLDKLHQAELEIDSTLFVLQLYLEFKGKPT